MTLIEFCGAGITRLVQANAHAYLVLPANGPLRITKGNKWLEETISLQAPPLPLSSGTVAEGSGIIQNRNHKTLVPVE